MDLLKRIMMTIVILFSTLGCAKTMSIEQVYKKNNPHKEIIHIEKDGQKAFVLYDDKEHHHIIGADEYQLNGHKWTFVLNEAGNEANRMMFTSIGKDSQKDILYGVTLSPLIKRIYLRKQNGQVIHAKVIKKYGVLYWYLKWHYSPAELIGLNADGKDIYHVPFK